MTTWRSGLFCETHIIAREQLQKNHRSALEAFFAAKEKYCSKCVHKVYQVLNGGGTCKGLGFEDSQESRGEKT